MPSNLIIVNEYCEKCHLDPSFILLLEEDGLINVRTVDGQRYLEASELYDLERFARWYYDLSINIEGISVIRDLLDRIHGMENEIRDLRRELQLFRSRDTGEAIEL